MSENDCILFIDESMAKTLIACRRINTQDAATISKIVGTTKSQAQEMIDQATAIGAIDQTNTLSAIAEKCINAIIKKRVEELK